MKFEMPFKITHNKEILDSIFKQFKVGDIITLFSVEHYFSENDKYIIMSLDNTNYRYIMNNGMVVQLIDCLLKRNTKEIITTHYKGYSVDMSLIQGVPYEFSIETITKVKEV